MKFMDVALIASSVFMVGGKLTGLINVSWLVAFSPIAVPFALGGAIALAKGFRKKD